MKMMLLRLLCTWLVTIPNS
ncbi:hypothetical protein LINGRAHAP2_LOCUS10739 [Linum grandiflorum]